MNIYRLIAGNIQNTCEGELDIQMNFRDQLSKVHSRVTQVTILLIRWCDHSSFIWTHGMNLQQYLLCVNSEHYYAK